MTWATGTARASGTPPEPLRLLEAITTKPQEPQRNDYDDHLSDFKSWCHVNGSELWELRRVVIDFVAPGAPRHFRGTDSGRLAAVS